MISPVTHRERIVNYSHKKSVAAAAMVFSVSRSTIYRWRTAYALHGPDGLIPRSTAPRRPRTVLTPHIIHRALQLRRTGMGAVKIGVLLRREGLVVSHMTVHRLLRRLGLVHRQRQRKRHYRPWARERPNELWQLDFKGPYLREGQWLYRLDVIDDASRFLVASVECEAPTTRVALEVVRSATRRFGRPVQVLTDNGAVFAPVRGKGVSAFQEWCIRRGIQQVRARPYHPQTNGKVERVHRTITEESVRMGLGLDEYVEFYNHTRPHASLGNRSPAELYLTPRRRGV